MIATGEGDNRLHAFRSDTAFMPLPLISIPSGRTFSPEFCALAPALPRA
jgi:hypothetical protein